ncbi:hypothetical protein GJR88_02311 [Dietzia sp. DQ12-45-1b]|nr:hypothetical protein GJR88_02311 [Dietzia sp. DQ12-45-1b]
MGTRYVVGSDVQEEPDLPPSDASGSLMVTTPGEGPAS